MAANLRATSPTVRGAGADVARAQAGLDDARQANDRAHLLLTGGAITAADLDSSDNRLRQARASLDALLAGKDAASARVRAAVAAVDDASAAVKVSEAALALANVQLSESKILSPLDGIVVDRNLEPGEWVSPGMPVVTVEDSSQRWVRIDVEETRFSGLKPGAPAAISVEALPGQPFKGHIIEVGAEADFALNRDVKRGRPDLRTFRVRVAIDEGTDALRPGMTAEVSLPPGP